MMLVAATTLVLALALAMPIGMAVGLTALSAVVHSYPEHLVLLPQKFLAGIDSFPLLAIPLFILSGAIMGHGGIARRIVALATVFVGGIRGGLGLVVVLATMLFSGISGSSSADTAAIGSVTLPAMKDRRYPPEFATAVVAAAGATAALVPPSIDLIIIGIVANISIAGLFAAGFLPGVVNALGIMALVYWYARKLELPLDPPLPWRDKLRALRDSALAVMMAVIILGGILGGIFTPTEASAVAVVYGFLVSMFVYRELRLRDMPRVLLQTCELTGVVMFMIGTASVLSFVLTLDRIPHAVATYISQHAGGWVQFVLLVNLVFFILGLFMDDLPALIVFMPILTPAAVSLGMDPIHFGILVAANVGLSLITPPVGVVLYVACGLSRLPIETVIRPLIPFMLVLVGTLLIISYVPAITLFVPRLLGHVH